METITIKAYTFAELSAAAQGRVFRDCMTDDEMMRLHYEELRDIDAALDSMCLNSAIFRDRVSGRAWVTRIDFFECVDDSDGYGAPRDCYEMDLQDAFNAHVPELQRLRAICERDSDIMDDMPGAFIYDVQEHQDQYTAEFRAALVDVAKVYNKLVDGSFEYWTSDTGACEEWSANYEWYTDGRLYDADGRDITELVERYA